VRTLRIVLVVLVVLAVVAGAAWLRLTAREMPPDTSDWAFDLAEIRQLAGSLPGPAPLRVNAELVAEASLPRAGVFAGESFDPWPMVHQSFQIVFPDRFFIVDGGFSRAFHEKMGTDRPYHPQGWEDVQAALGRADAIFITHEHGDHLEGIARYPEPEALAHSLRLTSEQLANTERLDEVDLPAVLREGEPLRYGPYLAFAPGVVLVKAAGHTPGSQVVYVRLADGRELLLIGDVAWHMDAIRRLHYRPRLVTDWFLHEDRHAVLAQFRTLHDLDAEHPEVRIVVSHDTEEREALLDAGVLGRRFE